MQGSLRHASQELALDQFSNIERSCGGGQEHDPHNHLNFVSNGPPALPGYGFGPKVYASMDALKSPVMPKAFLTSREAVFSCISDVISIIS